MDLTVVGKRLMLEIILDIQEESEPVLEFENELVRDLLGDAMKITHLRGPNLKAETLNWGFSELFDLG